MEVFLIHIIKSSALLSIFFIAYHFLLRKDTSFNKNRFFLLAGIFSAAVLPFVHITQTIVIDSANASGQIFDKVDMTTVGLSGAGTDLWQIAGTIYLFITVCLLGKIMLQIFRIAIIFRSQSSIKEEDFIYIKSNAKISPFSFFNLIVFNPASHSEEELNMVLEHEKVHSKQFHTFDILLANIAASFLWFNPLSWLFRKCVEENIEYIADRETIKSLGKEREYQYALLQVSQQRSLPDILNHFHRSFIKNRIIMLKKGKTSHNYKWKHFLILPALIFFLFGFNMKEEVIFSNNGELVKSYEEKGQEPIFYIDKTTSDSYFRSMETYFWENHPGLQIAFTGITRDANRFLTGFQIETKFEGEEYFSKRMENLGKKELKPKFSVQYSPQEKALVIKELYEKEVQITITKEAIIAGHIEKTFE